MTHIHAPGKIIIMFAFSRNTHVGINQQVYSGVLVNNDLDLWWRDDVIEDTGIPKSLIEEKVETKSEILPKLSKPFRISTDFIATSINIFIFACCGIKNCGYM